MKRFQITVNGNAYDVQVEELGASADFVPVLNAPVQSAPVAPVVAKASAVGSVAVNAPMPGTVLDVKVKEGEYVQKDQLLVLLEAMKMENEIFSPAAGTVKSVNVKKGDAVNSNDLLISIG